MNALEQVFRKVSRRPFPYHYDSHWSRRRNVPKDRTISGRQRRINTKAARRETKKAA